MKNSQIYFRVLLFDTRLVDGFQSFSIFKVAKSVTSSNKHDIDSIANLID